MTYHRGHVHVSAKGEISRKDVEELRVLCWWEKPRLLDRFTPTLVLSREGYTAHHPVSLGCPHGTWTGDAHMSADRSLLVLAGIYSTRRRPGGEGGMIP